MRPFFVSGRNEMGQQSVKVAALIEPSLDALGYELVGIEYTAQGKHSILRVYIDSPTGVDVEDCQKASHQISGVLDVEEPLSGQYTLEVSSPGVERPLFIAAHFERFAGERAEVRVRTPIDGQRKFVGQLAGVEDNNVKLDLENGESVLLSLADLDKAKLKPDW